MGAELQTGFDCRVCGLHHAVLPLSYSIKVPLAALAVPRAEWERRVILSPDQCVIDERFHYLRGRFAIPVHGLAEPFIWGVWAWLQPRDFYRANQQWGDAARVDQPPYAALLNSELPLYGDTVNLPIQVRAMPVGRRPHFLPVDTSHPLAVEQREGIGMERVVAIAEYFCQARPLS